jgi:hypothetical protein
MNRFEPGEALRILSGLVLAAVIGAGLLPALKRHRAIIGIVALVVYLLAGAVIFALFYFD